MSAHTEEEFNLFLSQLKETNQTLDFFCDFEKINNNVEDIESDSYHALKKMVKKIFNFKRQQSEEQKREWLKNVW